jgi:GntR family transcriptional regulator
VSERTQDVPARPGPTGARSILRLVAPATEPRLPLWARVLADLRGRMASGEFAARFPGDAELVTHYGVSRHTVREAVRRLQEEGLLERRRGQGSFLVGPAIEQPLGTMYSLFRSVEATGATQESLVRVLERRHDDKAAAMLGCVGEPLIYLERLRLADGEPIALESAWLPAAVAEPLLEVDFRRTALYEELRRRCGVRLTSGWERIRPAMPDRTARDALGLDAGAPVFGIERFSLAEQHPIEWRHSLVRSDRFFFVARWSADQLDTAFEQDGQAAGNP